MPVALGTVASHRTVTGPTLPVTSGLVGWWDADDAATITHSSGAVSQWRDKSGNSNHAATVGGSTGPMTLTRTINGRNALDFNPNWSAMTMSHFFSSQPFTLIGVVQSDNAPPNNLLISGSSYLYEGGGGTWYAASGATASYGVAVDAAPHVVTALYKGATSLLWVDGVSSSTGNVGTGFGNISFSSGGSDSWDGAVAEFLAYNRELDTTEREQVESYLRSKWNTP